MKKILLLLILAALMVFVPFSFAFANDDDDGKDDGDDISDIPAPVKFVAKQANMPAQDAHNAAVRNLYQIYLFGGERDGFCSSYRIDTNWLLTASHCAAVIRNTDGPALVSLFTKQNYSKTFPRREKDFLIVFSQMPPDGNAPPSSTAYFYFIESPYSDGGGRFDNDMVLIKLPDYSKPGEFIIPSGLMESKSLAKMSLAAPSKQDLLEFVASPAGAKILISDKRKAYRKKYFKAYRFGNGELEQEAGRIENICTFKFRRFKEKRKIIIFKGHICPPGTSGSPFLHNDIISGVGSGVGSTCIKLAGDKKKNYSRCISLTAMNDNVLKFFKNTMGKDFNNIKIVSDLN